MLTGGPSALERRQTTAEQEQSGPNLHNVDESRSDPQAEESPESDSTRVATPKDESRESRVMSGLWGERDVGGPVNETMAMEDYEQLRRELTNLSQSRSKSSLRSSKSKTSLKQNKSRTSLGDNALAKTVSGRSVRRTETAATKETKDTEAGDEGEEEEEEFPLDDFMREGHMEKRTGDDRSAKRIGVLFKNLTVKGIGTTSNYVKTVPDAVAGTFGPDLYHILCRFLPFLSFGRSGPTRTLINDFTGLVRDGEMMLVLGRPGAGCSTLLKTLANSRDSFASITGDVSYGGIDALTQKKHFRGEVVYNPEDDIHFPDLNVFQTLVLALYTKTKKRNKGEIPVIANALMRMFGIPHTRYTKVGNEFVPGVSGGERKRVSIAESLAAKSSIVCWDNSTRGLDASTALDYARSLRVMTDISNKATITTLYQAGEGIYECADKVLVIDQGRCVYEGPANEARQYFIDLGFYCPDRQTTADFLTACTDPIERRFRDGYEDKAPKSPEELEATFRKSLNYQRVLEDVRAYEKQIEDSDHADAREFKETVREAKSHRTVPKGSPYTVSFSRQVLACAKREFYLLWGDKTTLYTKAFIIVSVGLIVASLFYGESLGSSGAFSRGGALFLGILFLGWLQLSELMKAVTGRPVVARQSEYAFYRPSAVTIARVLVDFPVLLPQVMVFAIIMYFLSSLDVEAGKFWIYALFTYVTTIMLTALYRMFAALSPAIDDAVRFSGISLNVIIIFTGYVIPKTQLISQKIWFGWIYYISPLSYSFEGVITNEFAGRNIPCDPSQIVPQGPNAQPGHQSCTLSGTGTNTLNVPGSQYLEGTFEYTRGHLWRNFGALIAFTVLYILITMFAIETFNFAKGGGGALMFKKTYRSKKRVQMAAAADEEKGHKLEDINAISRAETQALQEKALKQISNSKSIFTWENVNYTVPTPQGPKQLLNNVDGYAKPGVMIALMGASGAGKTTLLNTLSQRQFMGVVSGDMLVDGRNVPHTFARSTGFCLQGDIHDGTATIREALEFSAILRQERHIPRSEKLAYVDIIVDLLELGEIQDAVVSSLGVEQRKRLTIGVELAAKPQLLLFLDEPTSGLDSQSAYSIVRFLRKLSAAGQAIVCTIHQPSSVLIQEFDMILALNPGGNVFYFGDVGHEGSAVIKYFAERDFHCPPRKNIAEFILEVAAKSRRRPDGTRINWNDEWRNSKQSQLIREEIQQIKRDRGKVAEEDATVGKTFAASTYTQIQELSLRTFKQYWRDPSYYYGKLFIAVIVGIFNGFTFWQLGDSIQDMQNRMFTIFLIITIPPTAVNAVVPKFFTNMMIWQAREYPSRIYGWVAFCTAQVLGEVPISIIAGLLYWLLWYWPAGLPTDSETSGYAFLMSLLFFLFTNSWGQWITAFAPSFTVIANVLPFFFVMFSLFNGVVRPYASIPVFWRYWMYYVNPSTWWIRGMLSATLKNIPVRCAPHELARFTPPPGQTCTQYAGDFARAAGGHLTPASADSTSLCEYCYISNGNQFLSQLHATTDEKWRDFGIFLVFCATNYMLVYFFIWSCKIRGFGFGMGYLFGFLGKCLDLFLWPFKKAIGAVRSKKGGEASA